MAIKNFYSISPKGSGMTAVLLDMNEANNLALQALDLLDAAAETLRMPPTYPEGYEDNTPPTEDGE